MSHPLDGCWAKIERAKEQIRHLNNEITAITDSNLYAVVGETQADRKRYAFKVVGPPVPNRIAVLAGEIVHHLRSCYDHVIWALASQNGLPDTERVSFPVCPTPDKFKGAVKDGIIKGVAIKWHSLIEALQPYRADTPAENSVLQIIHDLDITDKHRLLIVVSHILILGNMLTITKNNSTDPTFGIELPDARTGRYPWAIEDGVEVHWVPLRGTPGTEFEMKISNRVHVAFEKVGLLKREPVVPTLMQLCQGTEIAIHTFDNCF